jgi:hypothetical protein
MSGLITITLASDLSGLFVSVPSPYFKLTALVCSAIGVSLSTFEAFIDHKRLWIQAGVALSSATLLRQRLTVELAGKTEIDSEIISVVFQELDKIVSSVVKEWADARSKSPDVLDKETFDQQRPPPKRRGGSKDRLR